MGPAILPTKPTGLRRTCVLDYPLFLLLFAIMPLTPSFSFLFFCMLIHYLFLCIAFALIFNYFICSRSSDLSLVSIN